ncbi:MAG: hypothetical protein HDQ88_09840 [Clostridia bacterium]|nr:hypothetical protein [Clostridia bacterium]
MRTTAHACLEAMMAEALNDLKDAYQKLMEAEIREIADRDQESYRDHRVAKIKVDDMSKRYSELLTAKRIIKEMEAKGVEI